MLEIIAYWFIPQWALPENRNGNQFPINSVASQSDTGLVSQYNKP